MADFILMDICLPVGTVDQTVASPRPAIMSIMSEKKALRAEITTVLRKWGSCEVPPKDHVGENSLPPGTAEPLGTLGLSGSFSLHAWWQRLEERASGAGHVLSA